MEYWKKERKAERRKIIKERERRKTEKVQCTYNILIFVLISITYKWVMY
jgi:hypothetical protein